MVAAYLLPVALHDRHPHPNDGVVMPLSAGRSLWTGVDVAITTFKSALPARNTAPVMPPIPSVSIQAEL